jgi:F-type H+-transporting ATPase subunit b
LNEAEERERQADQRARHYQKQTDELEEKRREILSGAEQEAEQQKKQMLDQARDEVAETRNNWQRQADDEKHEFLKGLRLQTTDAVQTIARRTLGDLADADLEERMIDAFVERLRSLDEHTRQSLVQTSEPVRVKSTFELDAAIRRRLTRAIHECMDDQLAVEYTRSPELLCGIELASGGQKLGWNMAEYMDELSSRIEKAFSPVEISDRGTTAKEGM